MKSLTFHANCLIQNVKTYILDKMRKIFFNVVCQTFYPACYLSINVDQSNVLFECFCCMEMGYCRITSWVALSGNIT